ncbi:RDD family protein [Paenibacillus thiaminolyticus]|uniref:RDD family protein n=1 Tax=Paenibacillus TaxID=44249 RepID=UPI001F0EC675|nr:RDD family protein [Paenibacillus dendritiformis]
MVHPEQIYEKDGGSFMHAGFWKRFFANLIDSIIIFILARLIVLIIALLITSLMFETIFISLINTFEHRTAEILFGILSLTIAWGGSLSVLWLYYAIMESSRFKGTLGKLALGIAVVDERFEKVSFGRASARYWSKCVSVVTLYIGFLMAGFTEKKQALHDKIANTYVVNKNMLEIGCRPESVQNSTEGQEPQNGLGQAY